MRNFILVIIAISSSLWQLPDSASAKGRFPTAKIRSAEPVLVSNAAQVCINSKIKRTGLQTRDRRLELVKWRFNQYHTEINNRFGLDEIQASRARACLKKYALVKGDSDKKVNDLHYCLQRYGLEDNLDDLEVKYTWFVSWLGFNLNDGNETTGNSEQVLECEKLLDPPPSSIPSYQFKALSAYGQVCARGVFNNELDVINFDQHCRNFQTELYYLVKKYTIVKGEGEQNVDKVAAVISTCFSDGEFERQAGVTNANDQRLKMYQLCINTYGREGMFTDMKNLLGRFADNLSSRRNKAQQIECFLK